MVQGENKEPIGLRPRGVCVNFTLFQMRCVSTRIARVSCSIGVLLFIAFCILWPCAEVSVDEKEQQCCVLYFAFAS